MTIAWSVRVLPVLTSSRRPACTTTRLEAWTDDACALTKLPDGSIQIKSVTTSFALRFFIGSLAVVDQQNSRSRGGRIDLVPSGYEACRPNPTAGRHRPQKR